MSQDDDSEPAPVVTVTSTSPDEASPLSTTTNLPAAVWPPRVLGDLMTRRLITVAEGEPIGELEESMQRFAFHHLPVVDGAMRLVGLISRTDYLHARLGAAPDGKPVPPLGATTPASAIMRRNVVFGHMGDSLRMACDVMLKEKLSCLPVVLDDRTLVGIVTTTDVLRLAHELLS